MDTTPAVPRRAELRLLLAIAALTLGPFIGLAIWAREGGQQVWEQGLLNALFAPTGPPGVLSSVVNTVGTVPLWAVVVFVATVLMLGRRGTLAAALVAISFASDLAAFVVKVIVERERPATAVVEEIFGADSFSFPSGHTVRATALVSVVIWLLAPARLRVPLAVFGGFLAGLVMGYARVSLGVHWPTDTLGGTLLGICWFALTTILVFNSIQPRQEVDRPSG